MIQKVLKIVLIVIVAGFFACSGEKSDGEVQSKDPKEAARQVIDSLTDVVNNHLKEGSMPDVETTLRLIEAYEFFSHDFPEDSMSGLYLRKTGELYENILNDKRKAIKRYMQAYKEFNNFEQRPMALFRAASLYQDLGDTTAAISGFKLFIEKHPGHDFVDDAENMINITRMGMEEFIKQSIEKSKKEEESKTIQ